MQNWFLSWAGRNDTANIFIHAIYNNENIVRYNKGVWRASPKSSPGSYRVGGK